MDDDKFKKWLTLEVNTAKQDLEMLQNREQTDESTKRYIELNAKIFTLVTIQTNIINGVYD
jgi:hypothetical protein